jgi:hypothetical protein
MDLLLNELLGFSQEFSCQNSNSGSSISDLLILSLSDIYQYFGGRVIDVNRSEDGGTVISHSNALLGHWVSNALQDFVHSFGSQGGLDEISNGDCAYE